MDIEKRTFQAELRLGSDKRKITGYGALFDSESIDMGFVETIKPGAFRDTLNRDLESDPVYLLWQHDEKKPLGSTKNGTLKVWEDSRGLAFECHPPRTSWSVDARESVKTGLISQCSFGFEIQKDEWSASGDRRELQQVRLREISIVTFPAYEKTSVEARKNRSHINMENLKAQAIVHLEKVNEYRNDPSRIDDYNYHTAEYDSLAERLAAPTFRDAGFTGVDKHWAAPVREPISRPNPGEFRDNARISGGTDRAGLKPWKTRGEFLQAVYKAGLPSGDVDVRLNRAVTGMSEGIPSDGGFLVENDFGKDIVRTIFENGDIIKRCNQIEISKNSNSIKLPGIDETSRATGSRWGGIQGYWLEEAGEKTASKPTFKQLELNLHKIIGLCYITDELLQDAGILEKVLIQGFTDELNFLLQDSIFNGSGVGQCLGIMNSGGLVTVDKEGGQAANTFLLENAVAMWARMPGPSRKNAIWCISQDVEPSLYTMSLSVGTGGAPCFLPGGQASSEPFSTLFGRPVVTVESCQTLGTTGDICLIDFSQYLLARKGGIQRDMSIHIRFQYDESCMRMVLRADGQPNISSPITSFKGGVEMSPFIALQTRS